MTLIICFGFTVLCLFFCFKNDKTNSQNQINNSESPILVG
jgi:hypothetical protein